MNQIQFGVFQISGDAEFNRGIRAQLEGPLNNGWWLSDWKVVEKGVDVNNQTVIYIAVCLQRDTDLLNEDESVEEDA